MIDWEAMLYTTRKEGVIQVEINVYVMSMSRVVHNPSNYETKKWSIDKQLTRSTIQVIQCILNKSFVRYKEEIIWNKQVLLKKGEEGGGEDEKSVDRLKETDSLGCKSY